MRKKAESKHSRDTRYRLQGCTKFIQYNEFLKSWESRTRALLPSEANTDLSTYALCCLICTSKEKILYQVYLFLFLQILAWKKKKKGGFFFCPHDNIHIYFLQKAQNPNIRSSLTSGNIILIFWESKEPQNRPGHNDPASFMGGWDHYSEKHGGQPLVAGAVPWRMSPNPH